MIYFGDFVALIPYIILAVIYNNHLLNMNNSWFYIKLHAVIACINNSSDKSMEHQVCIMLREHSINL